MSQTPAAPVEAKKMSEEQVKLVFVALTQAAAKAGIPSIGGLHSTLGDAPPPYKLTISNTSEAVESNQPG